MKRLALLLCLFALIAAGPVQSQAQLFLGLEGGWNKNHLSTSNASDSFTSYKDRNGFSVGVPVLYRIKKWLAVEADPSYIQKNYRIERSGFFAGVYQENTNAYIQLPVMAQLSLGGKALRGFVDLGVYGAWWSSGRVKGVEPNILNPVDTAFANGNPSTILGESNGYSYNEKYSFNSTRDNRIELGVIAGAGVSYEWKARYLFFVEARYTRSLTDQQKSYELNQTPRYNDTYGVSAGCMLRMKQFFRRQSKNR